MWLILYHEAGKRAHPCMLPLFLIRTSANQSSCTLGVWGAYDPLNKALVLDTEGMLGISNTSKQRKRLLLKVLVLRLDCCVLYPFPLHNQLLLQYSILLDPHTLNVWSHIVLFIWEHLNPWQYFFGKHSMKASTCPWIYSHLKFLFLRVGCDNSMTFFSSPTLYFDFLPNFILILKSVTKLISNTLLSPSQEAHCQSRLTYCLIGSNRTAACLGTKL